MQPLLSNSRGRWFLFELLVQDQQVVVVQIAGLHWLEEDFVRFLL
jgi:hypothetical protein